MPVKYIWLANILKELLLKNTGNGVYKLPSESILCERYHVSRQTVRTALRLLEEEGLIEKRQGSKVPILIWRLQPNDEHNLDIYEGYPHLYRKEMLKVTVNGKRVQAMVYIMNKRLHPYGTPSRSYFDTIRQGYKDSGFDAKILRQAVLDSVWESHLSKKYEGGE